MVIFMFLVMVNSFITFIASYFIFNTYDRKKFALNMCVIDYKY